MQAFLLFSVIKQQQNKNTMNNETKQEFQGYQITIGELVIGGTNWFVSRIDRISKRARFGFKNVSNYRFRTEESRNEYVAKFKFNLEKTLVEKEVEKQKVKEIRANAVNPYKVGDVFYDSWGYEQTNIDFYKIVEVKNKSVVICKIAQTLVREAGWLCEYVKPNVNEIISEPQLKKVMINRSGQPHINGYRGYISPYTYGNDGIYQSHYA